MLLVLIILGIGGIIAGVLLDRNNMYSNGGLITGIVSGFLTFIFVVVYVVLLVMNISISHNDERIAIYQAENEKIESTISAMIEEYKDYEKDAYNEYKPDTSDLEVAVMQYPELRASTLVQEYLRIYTENRQQIKELEVAKVDRRIMSWWLWFGDGQGYGG